MEEGLAANTKSSDSSFALSDSTTASGSAQEEADFAIVTAENFQVGLQTFTTTSVPRFVGMISSSLIGQINGTTAAERQQNFKRALEITENSKNTTQGVNLADAPNVSEDILKYVRDSAALNILRANLLGNTKEEKLALLEKLESFAKKMNQIIPNLDNSIRLNSLSSLLELLAGADGYLNFGDQSRILPSVPALVAEIADQKIKEGLQSGLAKIPAEIDQRLLERRGGRFLYRLYHDQTILPFKALKNKVHTEINQKVSAGISTQLSAAYAQKWTAVQNAGAQSSEAFNKLMSKLGVQSFYIDSVSDTNYIDYEKPLNSGDLRNFASALKIDLANPKGNVAPIGIDVSDFDFLMPDGIPIREILRLIEAEKAGQNAIPDDLSFRFNKNGQLVIAKKRSLCKCEPNQEKNNCQISFKISKEKNFDPQKTYYFESAQPAQCSDSVCQGLFTKTNRAINLPKACGGVYSFANNITAFAYNQNTSAYEIDRSSFANEISTVTPKPQEKSNCRCDFSGATCSLTSASGLFLASKQASDAADCSASCGFLKSVVASAKPPNMLCN